jgi:hypothetical protein
VGWAQGGRAREGARGEERRRLRLLIASSPSLVARAQVIADSVPGPNGEARPFYDFLESCLRHKGELVRWAWRSRAALHAGLAWAA